ncbi:hypothetical protein [Spirosoma koreense]
MKHIGTGLLWALAGYCLVAVASYFLILWFSSNTHDRHQEAGMTSVFVVGPAGAIIAFLIGIFQSLYR